MPDDFLGFSQLEWTAVQAIAVAISSFILVVTVIVGVRQLRQAARSAQFDAVIRMQELVDDFREDRRRLFENLPLELAFTRDQFALKLATRREQPSHSFAERRRMLLTLEQTAAMESMTEDDIDTARRVITRFNDLGQLVEGGFFPEATFYNKHHLMVLRSCHMVEPVRQYLEDESEGGNYGRTLLRMRTTAARYYEHSPKDHDVATVYISNSRGRRRVYQTEPSPLKRARRAMARPFRKY